MKTRNLLCDSMYATYYLIRENTWSLLDVGFSSRITQKYVFTHTMSKEEFFDIYDGVWPLTMTSGDFEDWTKLKQENQI